MVPRSYQVRSLQNSKWLCLWCKKIGCRKVKPNRRRKKSRPVEQVGSSNFKQVVSLFPKLYYHSLHFSPFGKNEIGEDRFPLYYLCYFSPSCLLRFHSYPPIDSLFPNINPIFLLHSLTSFQTSCCIRKFWILLGLRYYFSINFLYFY